MRLPDLPAARGCPSATSSTGDFYPRSLARFHRQLIHSAVVLVGGEESVSSSCLWLRVNRGGAMDGCCWVIELLFFADSCPGDDNLLLEWDSSF